MVPRKVMLIDNFFSLTNNNNIIMHDHLTQIKNVVDQLEEIG